MYYFKMRALKTGIVSFVRAIPFILKLLKKEKWLGSRHTKIKDIYSLEITIPNNL